MPDGNRYLTLQHSTPSSSSSSSTIESFVGSVADTAAPWNDPIEQLYFVGVASLGLFLFYRMMVK